MHAWLQETIGYKEVYRMYIKPVHGVANLIVMVGQQTTELSTNKHASWFIHAFIISCCCAWHDRD